MNGDCTTFQDINTYQTGFGCLGCRPSRLQFLAGARWFLLFVCLTGFCQSLVVNGLIGVTISTIGTFDFSLFIIIIIIKEKIRLA